MSRISVPILIVLTIVCVIGGFVVMNSFFYGQAVAVVDQRVVLADIGDFAGFVADCGDNDASTDEIVTMRDDPGGNCLLLRVQVLLKHIYEKKGTHTGQIIVKNDDFALTSGSKNLRPVLLAGGNQLQPNELVIRALNLHRAQDGSIEYTEAGSGGADEKPTLGDLTRKVKAAQRAASFGGGGRSRGLLDWVPAPLEERSKIIQPPSLSGYVWRAQLSQNIQDAWKSAEVVCLFPLPPPSADAKVVVFGDAATAVPIAVN